MKINKFLGFISKRIYFIILILLPLNTFAISTTNILLVDTKQCLHTESFNIASRLIVKECDYTNNQQFLISDGFIKSNLDQSKCLTTNSERVGSPVILWGCENEKTANQKFLVQDKIYLLANRQLCLAKEQGTNNLTLNNCNSSSVVSVASTIKTYNQKCLHLDNAADNTLLVAKDCDLSTKQLFYIDGFKIRTALDVDKCLDTVYFDEKSQTVFIKPCLNQVNLNQQLILKNGNIKRGESDRFCFTYFLGNKFDVENPIVLEECAKSSSAVNYLKQKFSLGLDN